MSFRAIQSPFGYEPGYAILCAGNVKEEKSCEYVSQHSISVCIPEVC
jgi:hypothetical protein